MSKKKFNPLKTSLGNLISSRRKSYGYSQEEFAYAIGISARALSDIETGKSYPDLEHATIIDDYLDLSLMKFLAYQMETPNLILKYYFEEFETAQVDGFLDSMESILESIDLAIQYISENSLYYKKYLMAKAKIYLLNKNIPKAYRIYNAAYEINPDNYTKEARITDYRLYLTIQSIKPDLYSHDLNLLGKVARDSIKELYSKLDELEDYPELKLKYLFNILTIEVDNIQDYIPAKLTVEMVLTLSKQNRNMNIYYKALVYRSIIKFGLGDPTYVTDIDDYMEYFYINNQMGYFYSSLQLLKRYRII